MRPNRLYCRSVTPWLPTKKNDEWRLVEAGLNHRVVVKADTKAVAILEMQGYMKTYEGSVRIQKVNFRIQEE